ncbi:hypothetical protein [Oceanobacillus sp. CFH 90083]|uniref:hypothetical protein n=1 Tax=Oceanobacillus sp. CFH 90083 TaxID=2592336 RepID=UPI00128D4B36|nr:hypothetical protein [Oceanobacillus sp. CFH 90083]
MDWIFENLFLVIIIISGLIAFLGDSKKKQEEQKKKQSTPPNNPTQARQRQQPAAQRTRQQSTRTREQPRAERRVYREGERPDISAGSMEEQQKKQMERLADRYRTSSQKDMENVEQRFKDLMIDRKGEEDNPGKAEMKKRVSGNLDGRGLVNGIIMAEVLGSPRAKKPYQSIIQRRK